ncbi:uncharacterized protein LOC120665947 [Panicum virgatum]|uniref:uncharacterized protein LOC120665947 n=1 Tax=Panicum virgatum TaxID=38727 RepID=UPI0019D56D57|nr:uncharacterized protein LOC120665947 [Panicum virgatum]
MCRYYSDGTILESQESGATTKCSHYSISHTDVDALFLGHALFVLNALPMSKSEIRGKHDEDAMQLRRRSRSVSHPYKEGRPSRANVGAKEDAHHGQHQAHMSACQRRISTRGH